MSCGGILPFNLMYEPFFEYTFNMAERTTAEKYYGRFLNAVGLDFLLTRKRKLNPDNTESSSGKKSKKNSDSAKCNQSKVAPNQVRFSYKVSKNDFYQVFMLFFFLKGSGNN